MSLTRTPSRGQICILTSHAFPESKGGEETYIQQMSNLLSSKKIPYTVVSSSTLPTLPHLDPIRIPVFRVPFFGYLASSYLWAAFATLKLIQVHSRRRITILYSVETGYAGLAAVIASKLLRVPIIVHSHTQRSLLLKKIRDSIGDWRTFSYWATEKSVDRFVITRAKKLIAVSEETARFLIDLGAQESSILVAPSAIDPSRRASRTKTTPKWRLGMPDNSFVVGYLGRLERLKGLEVLLAAFADFESNSTRTTFLIIAGDGPDRENILGLVRERRIRGVRFLGYQDDARSFLGSLDVIVFPSFHEGSPISVLEAMAAGCLVVASDLPSIRQVAQDSAVYFSVGDSRALAQLLEKIELDHELAQKLSAKAQQLSSTYSTNVILPKILQFCLQEA